MQLMNPDSPQMDAASLSSLATGRSASSSPATWTLAAKNSLSSHRRQPHPDRGRLGQHRRRHHSRCSAAYRPESLHVVDQNENTLVELVRTLRSDPAGLAVPDFRRLLIDFGSTIMERMLRESPPYDYVLNFAVLKHVRSGKDVCSLLQR